MLCFVLIFGIPCTCDSVLGLLSVAVRVDESESSSFLGGGGGGRMVVWACCIVSRHCIYDSIVKVKIKRREGREKVIYICVQHTVRAKGKANLAYICSDPTCFLFEKEK